MGALWTGIVTVVVSLLTQDVLVGWGEGLEPDRRQHPRPDHVTMTCPSSSGSSSRTCCSSSGTGARQAGTPYTLESGR